MVGHLGSAALHRLRFGRNPLVLYRRDPSAEPSVAAHRSATRAIGMLSALWAAALVASALWPGFTGTWVGAPLFSAPLALSWGIAVGGLLLMAAAQASMGAAFRVGQHERDADELHTSGLHALSRNPIYLGSWAYLAGMALWSPSVALLALTAGIGVAMHQLVLQEEAFWARRSPEAFHDWCERVPRYLGRIRL